MQSLFTTGSLSPPPPPALPLLIEILREEEHGFVLCRAPGYALAQDRTLLRGSTVK